MKLGVLSGAFISLILCWLIALYYRLEAACSWRRTVVRAPFPTAGAALGEASRRVNAKKSSAPRG
jgi:hypothetical protein